MTPQNLKKIVTKGDGKLFTVRIPNLTPSLAQKIGSLDCIAGIAQEDAYELKISAKESNAIETIVGTIAADGGKIEAINTLEPSLEDVFLTVTGKEMRDQASDKNATPRLHDHGNAPKARVR